MIHPNLYIKPTDGQQYILKPIVPFPTCQNINTIQLIIIQLRVNRIICQKNSYLSDKGEVFAKGYPEKVAKTPPIKNHQNVKFLLRFHISKK